MFVKYADGAEKPSIKAMSKDNLPLALYEKHREELGLDNPALFENENQLFEERAAPIRSAVVFLPKSKPLIAMTLSLVSGLVAEGGTIVLAGANDAGIRSARDAYEAAIGPVERKIIGNHSALYVGKNKRLGAGKTWRDFLSFFPLAYSGVSIEAASLPGVFSAGSLDEGTRLLLDAVPYSAESMASGKAAVRALDMGCGAGIVGAVYKKRSPGTEVVFCDISLAAVHAAQETLARNGLAGTVVRSDVFDGVTGTFDLILCNPPFHIGIETDYSFIEKFARGARAHLAPGGEVWVVANAFLPYMEILERHIGPTEVAADGKKFRIYRSRAAA
ncbi:MAG TPA: class I SAM-dependent methyltransferase [Candidatus Paceibacterota bacterium]|nr:class I SAM-dependent methyltransferase [Candidatus Paceibacterota bacterium]